MMFFLASRCSILVILLARNAVTDTVRNGVMTFAGVIDSISGRKADLLIRRDLVEQIGRMGALRHASRQSPLRATPAFCR